MVWLYFEELMSDSSAKCNACRAKLSYQGGSTSNLKKHLASKHPHVLSTDAGLRRVAGGGVGGSWDPSSPPSY